jgi:hypothetical protein
MDFDELLLQYPSLVAADLHAAMLSRPLLGPAGAVP